MELEWKRDFDRAARRWDAFWRGENVGPQVGAIVPRPGTTPVEKPPYAAGWDGDFAPVIEQLLRWGETHEFLGDAIPWFYAEFTADHSAVLMGAGLEYEKDGHGNGWTTPVIRDIREADIRVRRDTMWYERTVRFFEELRKACDGKLLIAAPTLSGGLDNLASLRGTEALLVDLVEHPEAVKRALEQVDRAFAELLEEFAGRLDFATYGSINRHGMYSTGRVAIPQCDFSCMISEEMYREFELPCLEREMALLDAVEYHLDGPGAIRHLEALCSLERLGIVQWVPGSGWGEQQDWSWLYRKIDELGKGQIRGGSPERVRAMWREYRSKKLFAMVSGAPGLDLRREVEALGEMPKP